MENMMEEMCREWYTKWKLKTSLSRFGFQLISFLSLSSLPPPLFVITSRMYFLSLSSTKNKNQKPKRNVYQTDDWNKRQNLEVEAQPIWEEEIGSYCIVNFTFGVGMESKDVCPVKYRRRWRITSPYTQPQPHPCAGLVLIWPIWSHGFTNGKLPLHHMFRDLGALLLGCLHFQI